MSDPPFCESNTLFSPFTRRSLLRVAGASSAALLSTAPAQAATVRGGIATYYNNNAAVQNALGAPLSDEQAVTRAMNVSYQQFQRGIIIWNDQRGCSHYTEGVYQRTDNNSLFRRMDKTLTAKDVLVFTDSQGGAGDGTLIGDYQSTYQSWITMGLRGAGWNTVHFHHGGRGANTAVGGSGNFPSGVSYLRGVRDGANPLPLGRPGLIWISVSYNDFFQNPALDQIPQWYKDLASTLEAIYPGVPVVFNEVISRLPYDAIYQQNPNYWNNRNRLTTAVKQLLAPQGYRFLPNSAWYTTLGINSSHLENGNPQNPHMNLTGHSIVAPHVTAWLKDNRLAPFAVRGGIKSYYDSHGGSSTFGTPTQSEFTSVDGGAIQNFSKGWAIYWTPTYGAHAVRWGTAIGAKYRKENYELGLLGYPISDEKPYGSGVIQEFWKPSTNKKYVVAWSPATQDAFIMVKGGAIYGRFMDTPSIGFPVTDEFAVDAGVVQYFRNSAMQESGVYWSPNTGAKVMNSKGALYFHYVRKGYTTKFGFPVTDETTTTSYTYIRFNKGYELRWTANGGVQEITL